jgi:hypothetical protein
MKILPIFLMLLIILTGCSNKQVEDEDLTELKEKIASLESQIENINQIEVNEAEEEKQETNLNHIAEPTKEIEPLEEEIYFCDPYISDLVMEPANPSVGDLIKFKIKIGNNGNLNSEVNFLKKNPYPLDGLEERMIGYEEGDSFNYIDRCNGQNVRQVVNGIDGPGGGLMMSGGDAFTGDKISIEGQQEKYYYIEWAAKEGMHTLDLSLNMAGECTEDTNEENNKATLNFEVESNSNPPHLILEITPSKTIYSIGETITYHEKYYRSDGLIIYDGPNRGTGAHLQYANTGLIDIFQKNYCWFFVNGAAEESSFTVEFI